MDWSAYCATPQMSPKYKISRLHQRKDILRVVRSGRRVRGSSYDLIALTGGARLRVAVVVPLLGRNAVERNRVRRRTKEALRRSGILDGIDGDVMVRARRSAYGLCYQDVLKELGVVCDELKKELEKDAR